MLSFIAGFVAANAGEWYIHKHLLHGQGKKKGSFWRFHWADHHKTVFKEDYRDHAYERNLFESWNPQSKEAAALVGAAILVSPTFPIAPMFTLGMWTSIANYYYVHKRSHLEPEWGKNAIPWHYDHHMGPDQDQNWCVSFPLWDYVMGTRVLYRGTEKEKKDIERKQRRREKSEESKLKKVG
jgi:sterol desaturase/sphingolipid hydroxylase (fatty acid hydroxylase superfamily)